MAEWFSIFLSCLTPGVLFYLMVGTVAVSYTHLIMDRVDISKKVLNSYTPYKKGLYNLSEESATINAMAIRRLRGRKSD